MCRRHAVKVKNKILGIADEMRGYTQLIFSVLNLWLSDKQTVTLEIKSHFLTVFEGTIPHTGN